MSLSSFEDLEDVARKISTNEPREPPKAIVEHKEPATRPEPKAEETRLVEQAAKRDEPQPRAEPKKEEKSAVEPAKEEAKRGLGRLFGKKKK